MGGGGPCVSEMIPPFCELIAAADCPNSGKNQALGARAEMVPKMGHP